MHHYHIILFQKELAALEGKRHNKYESVHTNIITNLKGESEIMLNSTETYVCHFIEQAIAGMSQMNLSTKNICFAGGVSLNSVALGKITSKYKDHFENFFVPPVPYDGGLSIGACQYLWHSELGNDVEKDLFVSPYLGEVYSKEDVLEAIEERNQTKVEQ